ncbi:nitroreductase family deazaflavin-dependent oxidoreductase [Nocardiopsis sp. HNM0947]|uniref:Nitroreductase family deazaflavin-dependent oxidoreductase n=1 Tax=Nocardiopsis coralli TaxID=2772213 RepID=A0ABR9PDP9_9ACTN|nr:nitroreductase/quinone reductase family protein [Nocardiopsis coralli]MBE3001975.1 nitroreductase family deazaflavin-dependent oxidoreductase [Nocardiopsis coralli]
MGVLTPLAVRIGALPWLPRFLRQITWCDRVLQRTTGGRVGLLDVAGLPNVLLTVRGRVSGRLRSTPLLCVRGGDRGAGGPRWLIAGSSFGSPSTPAWVHNLREASVAEISKGAWSATVVPEELGSDERARAWDELCGVWPNFEVYRRRTERVIPVFRLVPADSGRRDW